jgi:16S rRNA (cytosine967-C5)-methyltransferase
MAKDMLGDIDLTVSDVRESILINLKKRFNEAGITKYKSFIADLTQSSKLTTNSFHLIIADVPCTGSGTWSRNPEQLYYFEQKKIEEYSILQKKIVSNVIKHLQPGGYLLYITCSVFIKENEEVVDFIEQNFHLDVIKMEVLRGYDMKADTMFAALLQKPL